MVRSFARYSRRHERRRVERRQRRDRQLTHPKSGILITTSGVVVLGLFLLMVRTVVIAAILGSSSASIRPLHFWLVTSTNRRTPS